MSNKNFFSALSILSGLVISFPGSVSASRTLESVFNARVLVKLDKSDAGYDPNSVATAENLFVNSLHISQEEYDDAANLFSKYRLSDTDAITVKQAIKDFMSLSEKDLSGIEIKKKLRDSTTVERILTDILWKAESSKDACDKLYNLYQAASVICEVQEALTEACDKIRDLISSEDGLITKAKNHFKGISNEKKEINTRALNQYIKEKRNS